MTAADMRLDLKHVPAEFEMEIKHCMDTHDVVVYFNL